jgi:hypothetical protein
MTVSDQWTEVLRCPHCALAGVASLSQGNADSSAIIIYNLPSGFRNVSSQYGDTFFCESCNRAASASTK